MGGYPSRPWMLLGPTAEEEGAPGVGMAGGCSDPPPLEPRVSNCSPPLTCFQSRGVAPLPPPTGETPKKTGRFPLPPASQDLGISASQHVNGKKFHRQRRREKPAPNNLKCTLKVRATPLATSLSPSPISSTQT